MPLAHRRKFAVALVVFVALYVGGYLTARSQDWLIHRAGFVDGKTDSHSVVVGDLGPGWNSGYRAARASHVFFSPLRWGETAFWYVRHPAGKPWPYSGGA